MAVKLICDNVGIIKSRSDLIVKLLSLKIFDGFFIGAKHATIAMVPKSEAKLPKKECQFWSNERGKEGGAEMSVMAAMVMGSEPGGSKSSADKVIPTDVSLVNKSCEKQL